MDPIDISKLRVYRIVPIANLQHNLEHGLHCKNAGIADPNYVGIGHGDIIDRRNGMVVKCYPETVVNDYVPFYFSIRTPMLYNIVTGYGVNRVPQEDIIYLCCWVRDLATTDFQWCYTNGNAAQKITKFFRDLKNIETKVDWHSVWTTNFRDNNADGDEDRKRKKHAEFLVKDHVPRDLITDIVVLNNRAKERVEAILQALNLPIKVHVNPQSKFYF